MKVRKGVEEGVGREWKREKKGKEEERNVGEMGEGVGRERQRKEWRRN